MPDKIELSEKYEPLFDPKQDHLWDFAVITGGRGSGKSFAVTLKNLMLTQDPNHKILSLRYTMKSALDSIIPETLKMIELMNWTKFFVSRKSDIINTSSKAQVLYRGVKTGSGNQTANLKGIPGLTILHVEEGEEFTDEDTFDDINLSVRDDSTDNKTIWVMNPATKEHFIYKRFFEQAGVADDFNGIKNGVLYIYTDYRDNIKNLSKKWLASVERMRINNPAKYIHKVLGAWLHKAEGVIYTNWKAKKLTSTELQAFDVSLWGSDLGFSPDPTTLVNVKVDKSTKRLYITEHVHEYELLTSDIHDRIQGAAGRSLVYMDIDKRLIQELNNLGSNVQKVVKGDGSIEEGIMLIKEWDMIIDPESTNLIRELNNYVYVNKVGKSGTPVDMYNHVLDAMRYALIAYLRGSGNYTVL